MNPPCFILNFERKQLPIASGRVIVTPNFLCGKRVLWNTDTSLDCLCLSPYAAAAVGGCALHLVPEISSHSWLLPNPNQQRFRTVAQPINWENEHEHRPARLTGVGGYRTSYRHTFTIVRVVGLQASYHAVILLRTRKLVHLVCSSRFVRLGICSGRPVQRSGFDVRVIASSCSEHGVLCGEVHWEVEGPCPWTSCYPCCRVGPNFGVRNCIDAECAGTCPFKLYPWPVAERPPVPSSAGIQNRLLLDCCVSPWCYLYPHYLNLSGIPWSNSKPSPLQRL